MTRASRRRFFKAFYARRFFRIIPIYYLWTTLYIVLIVAGGSFLRAHANSGLTPQLDWRIYIHYLFLQNFFVLSLAGLAGAWFGPTWSLAIEEQFYLVAPAIVRLVSPKKLMSVLVATIVAIPILRLVMLQVGHPGRALIPVLMLTRADTLAMGIAAAELWRKATFRDWGGAAYCTALSVACHVNAWLRRAVAVVSANTDLWNGVYRIQLRRAHLCRCVAARADSRKRTHSQWLRECPGCESLAESPTASTSFTWPSTSSATPCCCIRRPRVSTPLGFAVSLFAAALTIGIAEISWLVLEGPFAAPRTSL